MRTVKVKASNNYNIYIDSGLLETCGEIIRSDAGGQKAVVITDTNIDKLHSGKVVESLEKNGYEVVKYVMPAGEENKNFENLIKIVSFMAQNRLSRKDIAVALGGGVVGDITGFAAAVYMRGIKFVQIPTTVLAAVDSSVGGKTAVDLPEGKNLAGAFYQPHAVICDTDCFATLPERDYNNGFAEVIKYGMIADRDVFDMLDMGIGAIVYKCVQIKADVVEEDEFESGKRQILNFGHSIGHAIEKASEFTMLHGEAVACGMVKVCDIAIADGNCSPECREILVEALKKFKLPVKADYDAKLLAEIMKMDKKASGDSINLVLPLNTGRVRIQKTPLDELESLIQIGDN